MTEVTRRLTPSKQTLTILFARSGNECAFDGCKEAMIDEENEFVGQICHIEAAMPGGERFNSSSNNEERRKPENLLLLCYKHHIKTNNVNKFPVSELKKLKLEHEARYQNSSGSYQIPDQVLDSIFQDLLVQIKDDTKAIRQDTNKLSSDVEKILQFAANLQIPGSNTEFGKQIDKIVKLRDKHGQKHVITLLNSLREENWQHFQDAEKYKLVAQLGIVHMELRQENKAASHFIEGYDYQPENAKAVGLASLGYAMLEDRAKALELFEVAIGLDKNNINAYSALIAIERPKLTYEELLEKIPIPVRTSHEIAYALAYTARSEGKTDQALSQIQIAMEDPRSSHTDLKSNMATILMESIEEQLLIPGQPGNETLKKANYIIELYTESWKAVKDGDLASSRSWWLINRGLAKRIKQDLTGSYEDMLEACTYNRSYENLKSLFVSLVDLQYYERAIPVAKEMADLSNSDEQREAKVYLAKAYKLNAKNAEAIALLKELLAESTIDSTRMTAQVLLLNIYASQNDTGELDKLADQMISDHPKHTTPYLEKARVLTLMGNSESAVAHLKLAEERITSETPKIELREIGGQYQENGEWNQAIRVYEMFSDVNLLSPFTNELLYLYYLSGEVRKLKDLCLKLIDRYGPKGSLAAYLCFVYSHVNDYPNAIKYCREYLETYPEDQHILSKLAALYFRSNEIALLKKLLSGIDRIDTSLHYDIQYEMAKMFYAIGKKDKFFKFSYTTWRAHINESNSNNHFYGLLLDVEQTMPHPADPEKVTEDCVVYIRAEDGPLIRYIICNQININPLIDEIFYGEEIAQALLGRKVGETCLIGRTGSKFNVVNIHHKYNYAMEEAVRLMQEKFIVKAALKKIKIGNSGDQRKDFREIFDALDQQAAHQQSIDQIYAEGSIPTAVVAQSLDRSNFSVWHNYMHWNTPGIFTTNDNSEIAPAMQALEAGEPIFIEEIGLYSLKALGLLETIENLPNKLSIGQQTLLNLNRDLLSAENRKAGTFSITKVGQRYVRHDATEEGLLDYLTQMQNLRDWILKNCSVLPCDAATDISAQKKSEMDELMGRGLFETLLTAQERKCTLFCEEGAIRGLAWNEYSLTGLNSHLLCIYLYQKKIISGADYYKTMNSLIQLNYRTIPSDSIIMDGLYSEFRDTEHPMFHRALEGLTSPMTTGERAMRSAIFFLYRIRYISITDMPQEEFNKLCQKVLAFICTHFQPLHQVHLLLLKFTDERFKNPFQKDEMVARINSAFKR